MLVLASADSRQLKSRKGKGSKKQPQPPGPQPQPQCETIELYYLPRMQYDCIKVTNPFEGRNQTVYNDIGYSDYYAAYGPPDKDGFFTDPPIGLKFESYQDSPAIPAQWEGAMSTYGYYSLAAGFMLDPTPTDDVAAPDTLYRSSIWYQNYIYSDANANNFFAVNRLPIVGGSGKYACAVGELTISFEGGPDCPYDVFRFRICNTCPDPEVDYE